MRWVWMRVGVGLVRMVVLVSCLVPTVSPRATLGGAVRTRGHSRRGRRGGPGCWRQGRLRLAVHLVRLDDLVFSLRALGAGLGALDLHLERGALRVRFGARRHAARLVGGLLYVGIEVYNEVADADVPLVVIVLEVGGVRLGRVGRVRRVGRVGRGASSAGRRALPHWRRHARRLTPAAAAAAARAAAAHKHAHTIVLDLQTIIDIQYIIQKQKYILTKRVVFLLAYSRIFLTTHRLFSYTSELFSKRTVFYSIFLYFTFKDLILILQQCVFEKHCYALYYYIFKLKRQ